MTGINTICSSVLNEKKNDEIRIAILVKHNTLRSSLALGVVENGQSGKYLRKASKMHELIASDLTTEVGCSVVKCSTQINVVCHYTTTLDNGMKLYTIGPTCKKCSGGTESCVDGLCPVSYTGIDSMCYGALSEFFMSDAMRIAVLAKHNTLRSSLALGVVANGQSGNYLRKASMMYELTYTCSLERSAIERAGQCEDISNSEPPEGVSENYQVFTKNINRDLSTAAKQAIQLWWSEITKLESGLDQVQNIYYTHLGINSFAKVGGFIFYN
ncbi:SCP-like protein [Oesophagostomum dentatum]|uniref:SCP-like protein n=1 Tax=Oesophagostomum dentatum TaxID=61180 RepID=A0A0B1TQI8_OESDE|nr:SCP-like protein [Oesophagostomum dentatum]